MGSGFFIFGYFGLRTNKLNGQTVKTRMIHNLFEEKLKEGVPFYDTEELKYDKLSLVKSLFRMIRCKHIIYIPAQNNLKRFFILLYILSIFFHFNIHYFVVGGWLPQFINKHLVIKKKLKNIHSIYVETKDMLKKMTDNHKFQNIVWFPNFRVDYNVRNNIENKEKLRLVFMSRITLEKGIDTIFSYLDSVKGSAIYDKITIDFFGQVDNAYYDWFFVQISRHHNSFYKGEINPEKVQFTLSQYDFMIFPTRYPGEGCPGIIIEAYMASVPVLASDWKYNNEFVVNGVTGFLYNYDNTEQLAEIIASLVSNRPVIEVLRKNAKRFSYEFTSNKAWEIIANEINII